MRKNLFKIFLGTTAITAIILSAVAYNGIKKIGFIDYNTIYNNCDLKKELEKDLKRVTNSRKSELDSLQFELSLLSNKINSNTASDSELNLFEDLKNRFLTYQEKYESENIRLKESYFNQIREYINKRAKEFAEMNNFSYLFSAMGDGALMYAEKSEEVTDEFLKFIDK